MTNTSWTGDRVKELTDHTLNGLSAGEIADRMGCSRNAVIGAAYRNRLQLLSGLNTARPAAITARGKTVTRVKVPRVKRSGRGLLKVRQPLVVQPISSAKGVVFDLCIPFAQRITIWKLDDHHCRWPLGEPTYCDCRVAREQLYCGGTKRGGLPYCAHHAGRAKDKVRPALKKTGHYRSFHR